MSGSFCAGEYQTDEEDETGSAVINFHVSHECGFAGPRRDYRERLESEVSLISHVSYENTCVFKRPSDKNEKFQLLKISRCQGLLWKNKNSLIPSDK